MEEGGEEEEEEEAVGGDADDRPTGGAAGAASSAAPRRSKRPVKPTPAAMQAAAQAAQRGGAIPLGISTEELANYGTLGSNASDPSLHKYRSAARAPWAVATPSIKPYTDRMAFARTCVLTDVGRACAGVQIPRGLAQ